MVFQQYSRLQEELDTIVSKYTAVNSVRSDVAELAKTPKYLELFRDVLENHIFMVKARPQAPEDGQVTVFDKALLVLTSNGKNLNNLGAIELFLDEVLGIKMGSGLEHIEMILEKNIALRSLIMHVTDPAKGDKFDKRAKKEDMEDFCKLLTENEVKHRAEWPIGKEMSSQGSTDSKDTVSRMLDTLERAEAEYYAVDEGKRSAKYLAAKFLRDTAENTLAYFKEIRLDDDKLISYAQDAYWLGQKKTVSETGGRLRPFEMTSNDYNSRARHLRDGRFRADCYRPGERKRSRSPARDVRERYTRHA